MSYTESEYMESDIVEQDSKMSIMDIGNRGQGYQSSNTDVNFRKKPVRRTTVREQFRAQAIDEQIKKSQNSNKQKSSADVDESQSSEISSVFKQSKRIINRKHRGDKDSSKKD